MVAFSCSGQNPGSWVLVLCLYEVTFRPLAQSAPPSAPLAVCLPSARIICADARVVSREPRRCNIRQLTCRRDCLTFSGWLRLSTLIYTRLSATASRGTATLTPGIIYHAQEACLPCRRDTFPWPGQALTFIGGWGVYSQRRFQQSQLNSYFPWWDFFFYAFFFFSCRVQETSRSLSFTTFAATDRLNEAYMIQSLQIPPANS